MTAVELKAMDIKAKGFSLLETMLKEACVWDYSSEPVEKSGEYFKALIFNMCGVVDAISALAEEKEEEG